MKRIGIIRGGISSEYSISLKTGGEILKALHEAGFEVVDMLLDKDGVLHIKGLPSNIEKVQSSVDYVWNALHGEFGEDGQIQNLLDNYGIPYSASGVLASSQAFNKNVTKEHAKNLGIKTPVSMLIIPESGQSVSETTASIYKTMAPPWIIKPLFGGSSLNTFFAFTPLELADIVDEALSYNQSFLVEQYIEGTEVAVGVIDDFRNKSDYILPVIDIKSPVRGFLKHEDRFEDYTSDQSSLRADEREKVSEMALKIHKSLGAKDYSQSEFIIDRFGKIWFIETDTHPALYPGAPFHKALISVGANLIDFVKSIINKN